MAGFPFNTFWPNFWGLVLIHQNKQTSLIEFAASLGRPNALWPGTLLQLDSAKGSILHCSAAIRQLRVQITDLARLMGPVAEGLCDVERHGPDGLAHFASLSLVTATGTCSSCLLLSLSPTCALQPRDCLTSRSTSRFNQLARPNGCSTVVTRGHDSGCGQAHIPSSSRGSKLLWQAGF
jgi:hypothetical protein